jgi:hypothetical protein
MGRVNDFIDGSIVIVPNLSNNRNRGVASILLAIHILCCPLASQETIHREDCPSLEKLEEEGTMPEKLTNLG